MGVHQQLWSGRDLLSPAFLHRGSPGTDRGEGKLGIAVLFTSARATLSAIGAAATLMKGLDGRLSLVAAQTVPYPLPLELPPVSLTFNRQRLLEVAAHSPVEMSVHLCVCRCRSATLLSLLRPGSMLLIGGRKTWRPTWERKLAKELRRDGLDVVLLEVG